MSTHYFWALQIRTELNSRLWKPAYLGCEAADSDLDWPVVSAMNRNWPRIENSLDGKPYKNG
jgi:hypothetical protein